MGGSQLKNLKAALKANGLTGQTNGKKKSKKGRRSPKEFDRDERQKTLDKIREQFNPFDVKANRNKKIGVMKETATKLAVGKPGITKQAGEDQRKLFYEAKKLSKNKQGGLRDKRFGERNKNLTAEDIMLERFTKERQHQSSAKRSLFNLDDSDNDDDGFAFGEKLTHYGKSLSLEDDFDEGDLGLEDSDTEANSTRQAKRSTMAEEQGLGDNSPVEGPARKKTKAEVMQEVIAKSKFYKHERQKAQEQLIQNIDGLDDDFDSIMSELKGVPTSTQVSKTETKSALPDLAPDYDIKVKELLLEKRAAPADRTKTDEELKKEYEDKQRELEQKREDRMNGIFNLEGTDEVGVEDLGEQFWEGSDSEQGEYGEYMKNISDSDDDVDLKDHAADDLESQPHNESRAKSKEVPSVPCPNSQEQLIRFLKEYPVEEHPSLVKRIIRTYQPRLAEGNKDKLGIFSGVLLRYIISLPEQDYSENVSQMAWLQKELIAILKSLSEKFTNPLSEECRQIIIQIQIRFKNSNFNGLSPADLVFFSIVGMLFSSSDHYHLVITPCLILISEFLDQIRFNSVKKLVYGCMLVGIANQYQRLSRRFIPEIPYFLNVALFGLLPEDAKSSNISDETRPKEANLLLSMHEVDWKGIDPTLPLTLLFSDDLDNDSKVKFAVLSNVMESLDWCVTNIWKDLPAFPEISSPYKSLLKSISELYPDYDKPRQLIAKMKKLEQNLHRVPLALQQHKPVAIPSNTPKFEENFNPEKKSYDPDTTRSELNKMKAQLKKERKFTMKEIRKDTRFEARQSIEEKKKDYAEYHSKMARIVNQISTEEGAEKNKYEREKKLRTASKR